VPPPKFLKKIRVMRGGPPPKLGAEDVLCTFGEPSANDNGEDTPTKPTKSRVLAHIGSTRRKPLLSTKPNFGNMVSQRGRGRLNDRIKELEGRLQALEDALKVASHGTSATRSGGPIAIGILHEEPMRTYNRRQYVPLANISTPQVSPAPSMHVHIHLTPSRSKWKW
jgi:hypothetical protein